MDSPRPAAFPDEPDRLAETIDVALARRQAPGERTEAGSGAGTHPADEPGRPARPVEMVVGSLDLSDETRELLRVRLRAVAIILLIGFAAFFIRNQVLEAEGAKRFVASDLLHALALAIQAAAVALLSRRRERSMRRLRRFEVVIFGTALGFFSVLHYASASYWIEQGDAAIREALADGGPADRATISRVASTAGRLLGTVEGAVISLMILVILYGLFVPNTWRRAARAVGLLVLTAGAVQASVLYHTAGHRSLVAELATAEQVSTNILVLLMAALIAVYGSAIINALRVEAFEARRLGQYILRGRLGGGGMGEVYLAEHHLLKRPCAIKLIRPDRAGDPVALRRFEREVDAMARLSHWNTVEIYDYGRTEDGTFYYVMEYLRGLPLDVLVERHGPLPPGRAVYLLAQACDSLAEAHAAGLVHRDLKPANLFAASLGRRRDVVKVLDFGLVKTAGPDPDDSTVGRVGLVTGTPLYMSPEQATGDPRLGPRSDLYALGAVARDPVVPPSELRPDLPADLERIVLRCLAKDPIDRFSSAESLGRALGSCACGPEWDAALAASWWEMHEPEAIAPT